MISAKDFASQGATWHTSTPTLEQYVRWANRNVLRFRPAIPFSAEPDRASLVAEAAFEMCATDLSPEEAAESARVRLAGLRGHEQHESPLGSSEAAQATWLAAALRQYLDRLTGTPVQFRPRFQGCGVVLAAEADVRAGDELVEVKAVRRGFRGLDIRQALTYAALAYAKGDELETLSLVNPRAGVFHRVSFEGLALDIGAGSWVELMQDLVADMASGMAASG